jgi:hypothetical protein
MKRVLRYLRIAFSVTCLIACVMLIVLWVRSCSRLDYCKLPVGSLHIHTIKGQIIFFALLDRPDWKAGSVPMQYVAHHPVLSSPYSGWQTASGFTISEEPPAAHLQLRFWIVIPIVAVVGILPWLPWRFTTRTLLIATTLVAVVLGLIVYFAR